MTNSFIDTTKQRRPLEARATKAEVRGRGIYARCNERHCGWERADGCCKSTWHSASGNKGFSREYTVFNSHIIDTILITGRKVSLF
jgi:hypothetical protein